MCHRVPLVCLCEAAHSAYRIQPAEDKGQDVAVQGVDNRGEEYFDTESQHLSYRTEIDVQRRSPRRVMIASEVYHRDVNHLLPREAPVRLAVQGEHDARYARRQ